MEFNGYKPGYIYVLRSNPYYKIGYADDVDQRLKQVGSAAKPDDLTEPIELLFSFSTTSKLIAERMLHSFFGRYRVKGEWFRLSERHLQSLQEFTQNYSVDQFVLDWMRLPSDVVLYSQEHIDFCLRFGIKHEGVMPDDLTRHIEQEKAKRARIDRRSRYQEMINKVLDGMSLEDLEWLAEVIMRRGAVPEPD